MATSREAAVFITIFLYDTFVMKTVASLEVVIQQLHCIVQVSYVLSR